MTEATIKNALKKKLEAEGWVLWFVHKRAIMVPGGKPIWRSVDIHTIYDCIALRDKEIKLIQFTAVGHMPTRRKKILKYNKEHNLTTPAELWGYRGRGKWKIETVENNEFTVIQNDL